MDKNRSFEFLKYLIFLFVGIAIGYFVGKNHIEDTLSKSHNTEIRTRDGGFSESTQKTQTENSNDIPKYALEVLGYVTKYQKAPERYVGGRKFKNLEKLLPQKNESGQRINYQEWDVHEHIEGQNRGAERLVTGDDGSAYFTDDHYDSFKKIR